MKNQHSLQAMHQKVAELIELLDKGNIKAEGLAELEELTRKIYEKCLIIHYKAKESKVFGASKEPEKAIENPTIETSNEEKESNVLSDSPIEPAKTGAAFTNESDVQFDFSSGFDLSNAKQEEKESPQPLEEKVTDHAKVESKDEVNASISESDIEGSASSPDGKHIDELHPSTPFEKHFFAMFKDASQDKLGASKLSSIHDAIGLNDKLLFIRELFKGEADTFRNSVQQLDHLNNGNEAIQSLSKIAEDRSWEEEDEVVQSFVRLVIRRYVD